MNKIMKVGPSPHVRTSENIEKVMYDVVIALTPAVIMSLVYFGMAAFVTYLVAIFSCLITEFICQKALKERVTISDGSALVTGLLLAMVLPAGMPIAYVISGGVVAMTLGKFVYGGLGHNIFNPALVGRAFVQIAWPAATTNFAVSSRFIGKNGESILEASMPEAVEFADMVGSSAGATVLSAMKNSSTSVQLVMENPILETFIGNMGGSLGETSALALLIGGIYLIFKRQIDWRIPFIIIASVGIITFMAGANPIIHILSGGLFLGAFFMATDMVTSPYTNLGKIIFALGIGLLVALIRLKGGYPEGMAFAILIMNGFVPLINKYTKPKAFGEVKS